MTSYVTGIDIGTGSTKAVALSATGAVLATAQNFYGTFSSQPDYSEQDPEAIWSAFVSTVTEISAKTGAPPQAISLSSCMHSLLLTDANGAVLTPLITWADRRSAAIAAALRATPQAALLYENTGTPIHAMSPLCKLRWFREHGLLKNFVKALSIKELIWFRLFGIYEIDYSIASATGLFDIRTLQWYQPALDYGGITTDWLSRPVPTHFVRKQLRADAASLLGLPPDTPFCIGASDGCLAMVGSNALQVQTAAVTIGTSGAVRIATPKPVVQYPDMLFNYILNAETFICGGAINNGGSVVQWLQQFFKSTYNDGLDYEALFRLAAVTPRGAAGLTCLPYFSGERTPLWDEDASGVFAGLRAHHGQAHFIRAALEGVCFSLYGILKKLETASGLITTLHVSGGMVHAPFWMQLLADITGKKVYRLGTEDASAVGAALFCMQALAWPKQPALEESTAATVLEPDAAAHAFYETRLPVFQQLYSALKPMLHQL